MEGCLKELELVGTLKVQDVDREIAFTLLSLPYAFERREIDQVVAYVVRADEIEVGRLVIAPGIGACRQVRIREHRTLLERQQQDTLQPAHEPQRHAEFADLCQRIYQALESVQHSQGTIESVESGHHVEPISAATRLLHQANRAGKDSDHYAYPPGKRQEIVRHYRRDRIDGHVRNKDDWARRNYQISGRTLSNYEREFPRTDEGESDPAIPGMAAEP